MGVGEGGENPAGRESLMGCWPMEARRILTAAKKRIKGGINLIKKLSESIQAGLEAILNYKQFWEQKDIDR